MELVVQFIGATALLVTAIAVIPQTIRMIRVDSTAGVSPVWAMLGAVSTGVWAFYTAMRGLWWATAADGLACLSYLSAVYVLARHGIKPRVAAGSIWLGVFVVGYLIAGLDGVGAVLGFAFVVQVAPSIRMAYRQSNLLGSSILTWSLTLAEGVLWFSYGWIEGDAAVTMFGLLAFLAGALMVARLWKVSSTTSVAKVAV